LLAYSAKPTPSSNGPPTHDRPPNLRQDKNTLETEGFGASVELTARTKVDQNAPSDPDAAGQVGNPYLWSGGAGVVRTMCQGSNSISGSTFSDRDEELVITFDAPVQREALSLSFSDISFSSDEPVIFVSQNGTGSFGFTIQESDILTAWIQTDAIRGTLDLGGLSPLPEFVMIDAIKIRETRSSTRVGGLCIAAPRRLDPTTDTTTFSGIPPVDLIPPAVVDAVATSNTSILVSFSEPLREGAANPLNFSVVPALVIVGAEATLFNTQVMLRTLPMQADVAYTLTVQNVQDLAGDVIGGTTAGVGDSASFLFPGNTAFEVQPPRVVGAISTGNTSVIVAFNKPMGDCVLQASSYSIVQVNVNPEVGALSVAGNRCDASSTNAGDTCTQDGDCTN